jgi:hypothetical protein
MQRESSRMERTLIRVSEFVKGVWKYARGNNGKEAMLLLRREVSVKFVVAIIEDVRNQ